GREVQPVSLASWDAWIKFYRADENSRNTSVSYYTKGAVVGLLLDMRIRAATGGAKSLDDVLRAAYARYAGARGFMPNEFRATAEAVAGEPLSGWFAHALDSTAELDYAEALDWLGLTFGEDPEQDEDGNEDGWIGVVTREPGGRLLVAQVPRDTPAHAAGFNVDDEILAIGGHRVLPPEWNARIAQAGTGARLDVLVARRGALRRIAVETAPPPGRRWELRPVEEPTDAQTRNRKAWLSGGQEPAP
ncbi:MAG: PDZ domain-containing protein, partial [Acidobacteria bacterium]|nr:PDZ domain-containing protein [Acidobacteriota bacterium]